jgi:hypothetical protein
MTQTYTNMRTTRGLNWEEYRVRWRFDDCLDQLIYHIHSRQTPRRQFKAVMEELEVKTKVVDPGIIYVGSIDRGKWLMYLIRKIRYERRQRQWEYDGKFKSRFNDVIAELWEFHDDRDTARRRRHFDEMVLVELMVWFDAHNDYDTYDSETDTDNEDECHECDEDDDTDIE